MTILEQREITPKIETEHAAIGRFFMPLELFPEPVEETDPESLLNHCIHEQAGPIKLARDVLDKVQAARDIIKTADTYRGMISDDRVEAARMTVIDTGSVWRGITDSISGNIAEQFPNQILPGKLFDTEDKMHISDGYKI